MATKVTESRGEKSIDNRTKPTRPFSVKSVFSRDDLRNELINDDCDGILGRDKLNKAPVVEGSIKDRTFQVLLDSGSDITAVNEELFLQLERELELKSPVLPVTNLQITTAVENKAQRIRKQTLWKIKLGDHEIAMTLLIIPRLNASVLIGSDWFGENNANIDYGKKCLRYVIDQQPREILFSDMREANVCGVRLTRVEHHNTGDEVCFEEYKEDLKGGSRDAIEERLQPNNNISTGQKRRLTILLQEYKTIFSDRPGRVENFVCELKVKENEPFVRKSYPVPYAKRKAVQDEIDRMLRFGVIGESSSPYSNPLVVVTKKDNTVRLCLDARNLNKILIPDRECPMPIDDMLYKFEGAKCFSTLDLTAGYWQVPLHPNSRKYTAFLFNGHSYEFRVLPFGLNISVGCFIKCVNSILGPDVDDFAMAYVDDIIIWSKDFETHLRHVNIVLGKLWNAGVTINFKKSNFLEREILFLGHKVSAQGIKINDDKVAYIREFPEPKSKKELQSFLGLVNFYRKFVVSFSEYTQQLSHLTKKNAVWSWGEKERVVFNQIKDLFINTVVLKHPDFSKPFYIGTDGSILAIGGCLYQENEEGEQQPIAFASRSLRGPETRYTITEIELLAVVFVCEKFRCYLMGREVIVRTDHQALTFLSSSKHLSGRLMRWTLALQEYRLRVEYVPGKQNSVADLLSRYPVDGKQMIAKEFACIHRISVMNINARLTDKLKRIEQLQKEDAVMPEVLTQLNGGSEQVREKLQKYYLVYNGVLFRRSNAESDEWKLWLPEVLVDEVIDNYHENYGHFGANKICRALRESCIFNNMERRIRKRLQACDTCQKAKCLNRSMEGEMKNVVANEPGEMISVDLMGPLPTGKGGVTMIFGVLDVFSKYIRLYAIKKATAEILCGKIINNYIEKHGKPKTILSDHGPQFISENWTAPLRALNIEVRYSAVFHPQTNLIERANREIGRILRTYCHTRHSTWPEQLENIENWINCTHHDSIGCTPYQLMYGKRPKRLIETLVEFPNREEPDLETVIKLAREVLLGKARKRKKRHDTGKPTKFEVGDLVLVRTHYQSSALRKEIKKLFLLYEGPYRIKEIVGANAYLLEYVTGDRIKGTFNVVTLKPYRMLETLEQERGVENAENLAGDQLNKTI